MKLTLTALTVAATMFASSASAFDPDDVQKLRDTKLCLSCDLKFADLFGATLSSANLSGANLKDAELAYTARKDAIFCNTTMTNGSVDNSGC